MVFRNIRWPKLRQRRTFGDWPPLVLFLLAIGSVFAEPGPDASPLQVKSWAFELANVGDFERFRDAIERLDEMGDHRLARTAWFHWGNLSENDHMMDMRTVDDVHGLLTEIREAYERALHRIGEEQGHARMQTLANLERIQEKLERFRTVQDGSIGLVDATETLEDLNAPMAAALLLEPRLDPSKPGVAQHFFLALVYRIIYVDHQYLRLQTSWSASTSRPDLIDPELFVRRLRRLRADLQETESLGETAIEHFGSTPHILDLRSLTADAYRYHALVELMKGTTPETASDLEAALPEESREEIVRLLEQGIDHSERMLDFVEGGLSSPESLSAPQQSAYPPATLDRYREQAADTLATDRELLESLSDKPVPAGRPREEPGGAPRIAPGIEPVS